VIVTGTCWSGTVRNGDRLLIEPSQQKVRVREVQVHGRVADRGDSGQRLALALHGVKKEELERGFQVASINACKVSRRVDFRINLLAHYKGIVKNRQRLHINHAGREVLGRIVLLDEQQLSGESGPASGLAQLHLEDELIMRAGDRLVLRFYSPVTTIAGGVILDPSARAHKRFDQKVLKMLAVREKGDPQELFRQNVRSAGLAGIPVSTAEGDIDDQAVVRVGDKLYSQQLLIDLATQIAERIATYAVEFPLRMGLPKEETRQKYKFPGGSNEWNALCGMLAPLGNWVVVGDRIAASESGPELTGELAEAVRQREQYLRSSGLQWPGLSVFGSAFSTSIAGLREEDFLRHLVERQRAVQINNEYYVHVEALVGLVQQLRDYFDSEADLQFGSFRELCGLTRKLGIPLLEYLDQKDYTLRVGDVRQAGVALNKAAD